MKKKLFFLTLISVLLFQTPTFAQNCWKDLVVTENTEVYIDTTSVKDIDNKIYARTKTIYTTAEARQAYVDKIKKVFQAKSADKKIKKWENFSYTITNGIYDCSNKRFKILEVEDYTSDNKLIIKTKKKEDKAIWLLVDVETVGDYLLFYICDKQY